MKYLLFLAIICSLLLQSAVISQNAPRPLHFTELWNNIAFYDTNLEKKRFASFLARFEGKIGLNVYDFPAQIYGVYYGVASQSNDYWNNSVFYGGGIRFIPFRSYRASAWYNEWIGDVKIFAEVLAPTYFKNASSAEAAGLAESDARYGIEIWHEWNLDNPNEALPWGELWMNLTYRDTNFGWEEFKNYVLYFQPKFGMHLGRGIGAYLRADVTMCGKEEPGYYFLNVADYGVGVRFEPWRNTAEENDFFRKFKMFAEILGVSYLNHKPADPDKEVSSDVRFGIEFSYGR
jgi:hypothetical protein